MSHDSSAAAAAVAVHTQQATRRLKHDRLVADQQELRCRRAAALLAHVRCHPCCRAGVQGAVDLVEKVKGRRKQEPQVCIQLELQVKKTSKSKACRTAKYRDKGRVSPETKCVCLDISEGSGHWQYQAALSCLGHAGAIQQFSVSTHTGHLAQQPLRCPHLPASFVSCCLCRYLGNHPELQNVSHSRMRQAVSYHPTLLPTCGIRPKHFTAHIHLDHIIPQSLGGPDHPSNLVLMEASRNRYFGANLTAEKVQEVGLQTMLDATEFYLWFHEGALGQAVHQALLQQLQRLRDSCRVSRAGLPLVGRVINPQQLWMRA